VPRWCGRCQSPCPTARASRRTRRRSWPTRRPRAWRRWWVDGEAGWCGGVAALGAGVQAQARHAPGRAQVGRSRQHPPHVRQAAAKQPCGCSLRADRLPGCDGPGAAAAAAGRAGRLPASPVIGVWGQAAKARDAWCRRQVRIKHRKAKRCWHPPSHSPPSAGLGSPSGGALFWSGRKLRSALACSTEGPPSATPPPQCSLTRAQSGCGRGCVRGEAGKKEGSEGQARREACRREACGLPANARCAPHTVLHGLATRCKDADASPQNVSYGSSMHGHHSLQPIAPTHFARIQPRPNGLWVGERPHTELALEPPCTCFDVLLLEQAALGISNTLHRTEHTLISH